MSYNYHLNIRKNAHSTYHQYWMDLTTFIYGYIKKFKH